MSDAGWKFAKELSEALRKVRPLGGSELFVKRNDDYYADPVYCGAMIEEQGRDLVKTKLENVRLGREVEQLRSQVEGQNKALVAADKLVAIHRDYTTMPFGDFANKYASRDGSRLMSEARSEYVIARSLPSTSKTSGPE